MSSLCMLKLKYRVKKSQWIENSKISTVLEKRLESKKLFVNYVLMYSFDIFMCPALFSTDFLVIQLRYLNVLQMYLQIIFGVS